MRLADRLWDYALIACAAALVIAGLVAAIAVVLAHAALALLLLATPAWASDLTDAVATVPEIGGLT